MYLMCNIDLHRDRVSFVLNSFLDRGNLLIQGFFIPVPTRVIVLVKAKFLTSKHSLTNDLVVITSHRHLVLWSNARNRMEIDYKVKRAGL